MSVCAAVGPDLLPRLAAIASERQVLPEETVFEEGAPADSVYVVVDGMLKLFKLLHDGRRQVVGFLVPGDFLGMAFGHRHVYTAEAVTEVALCRFRRDRFLDLLGDCPDLEKEILLRTSTELAAAQEQMLLLGRKTANERVASFVLSMAQRHRLAAGGELALPMSRSDIADYLGLTVETVSRTLSAMRRSQLLRFVTSHTVTIPHQDQLERASGA